MKYSSLLLRSSKKIVRFILDTHPWDPSKARVLLGDYREKEKASGKTNDEHMLAALEWIKRAQDATGNGGIAGRYLLNKGFTNPYPETSGHIVSTMIKAGYYFNNEEYWDRAKRIVDFLLSVQMDCGAFQGGEYVKGGKQTPAVFNTGQIMLGLIAWYGESGAQVVLEVLRRSADWLLSVQELDGSWLQYTYGSVKPTNYTRVAWPLAMTGKILSEKRYIESASKYFDWFLTKANNETGWVDNMGFYKDDHDARRSLTHTSAYGYNGALEYGLIFNRTDLIDLVYKASKNIINKFNSSGFISAVYDSEGKEKEEYSCLTGNCQLSIIWLKLYKLFKEEIFLKAAEKALDQVKSYQRLNSLNKGIRGGIAGSRPIWGSYIQYGYPNWAAKYFVDGLLLLEQVDADTNPEKKDFKFYEKE